MKLFLVLATMIFSSYSWAIDSAKCSSMLNNGLYKKYKWAGVGESNANAMTGETKSNFTSAPFKISTEGTTAISDPKYSSNVSTSQTQSTSSWGACSAFALEERKEQRQLYVEQNLDEIKKDVANGKGYHLEVLSWFALCDDSANADFNQTLQENAKDLIGSDGMKFTQKVDKLISNAGPLNHKCMALSSL